MMIISDRLTKARIRIQAKNPFFSYLSLFLKFKKDEKGEIPDWAGMGVSSDGELTYREDFVDSLSDDELVGVLAHEILHLALLHLLRLGNRDNKGWNISADLVVNCILKQNKFSLPKKGLMCDYDYSYEIGGKRIVDINEKTAEQIYDELPTSKEKKEGGGYGGFDLHNTKHLSPEEKRKLSDEWLSKVEQAYTLGKMKGDLPLGMEQAIGKLHKEEINWRVLLQRYLTNLIPSDYTWARRSKKSIAIGTYLPDIVKEKIDVCIAIDTSGSIGQEELVDFISEVVGISKAYKNSLSLRLLTHDVAVHNDYLIENGNIEKIKKIEIKGGGGTSHHEITEYINEKIPMCRAVVFFTDGESDIDEIEFDKFGFDSIFIISKNGTDRELKDSYVRIKLGSKGNDE